MLSFLPLNNAEDAPSRPCDDDSNRMDETLDTIVPASSDQPFDMRQVVKKIVDHGKFFEIQPRYAKNMVIGFARLGGRSVGIVGNQPNHLAGVLDIKAILKAARFIRFCDAFNIPLVTFEDVPGFLPARTRSGAASSRTAPSCCTPTAKRRCRRSPSSRARPTAVPTT